MMSYIFGKIFPEAKEKIVYILKELKEHAPFTAFGAVTGVVIMFLIVFWHVPYEISHKIFYILHPFHILLSALVTTALYKRHTKNGTWKIILIGYTGSIGIATLSDTIVPYLGVSLLGMNIPLVIPFLVKWWVNILAFAGIGLGYIRPSTKFPHAGHVLLSTWASLFNITQYQIQIAGWMFPFIFLFLFFSVWIPCCLSDIIYPLIFVEKTEKNL